jgi:lipopolysaccharide transport system ATP-binding protein
MSETAGGGRTVLFVSHNIPAMISLCGRAVILDGGRVSFCGPATEAAGIYLASASEGTVKGDIAGRTDRTGSGALRLTGFRMENSRGERVARLRNGENARLIFEYRSPSGVPASDVNFQFVLLKQTGEPVAQFGTRFTGQQFSKAPPKGEIICDLKRLPLVPEVYRLDAYLSCGLVPADYVSWLAQVSVADGDFYGSGYQVFEKESGFLLDGSVSVTPRGS